MVRKYLLTKVFVLITKDCGTNAKLLGIRVNLHQFYAITGMIRVKLVEHGPVKSVTHFNDLEENFSDINVDNV